MFCGPTLISAPGPVFQLAEKTDSKPVQCGFESHPGYFSAPGRRPDSVSGPGFLFAC
jgi:hypothetical protein